MKDPKVEIFSITVLGLERCYGLQISGAEILVTKTRPDADLVIVDKGAAEKILGSGALGSYEDIQKAALVFLNRGAKSVLLIGVEGEESALGQDYWASTDSSFWLSHANKEDAKEASCLLSSAISYSLGQGHSLKDALVIGKMYLNRAMRRGQGRPMLELALKDWPEEESDLPFLSDKPLLQSPKPFQRFKPGLYPIVDSSLWVKKLLEQGVRCMQLRIKDPKSQAFLEREIRDSVALAKLHGGTLFINDYWEEALITGATAVHLGQEDLAQADLEAIREKGMLLGLSTHCYYEVAQAHAINPSYIACGPIFATDSKTMAFAPQGIEQLQRWRRSLTYPLVAIGGISLERLPDILGAGVDGISMISAITKAEDPDKTIQEWLSRTKNI